MDNQEAIEQSKGRSELGDKFREIQANGAIDLIEHHIFKSVEREAFELYKKVDPTDVAEVTQSQMMGKIVDNIRSRIDSIISEGDLAKEEIKNFNKENENG